MVCSDGSSGIDIHTVRECFNGTHMIFICAEDRPEQFILHTVFQQCRNVSGSGIMVRIMQAGSIDEVGVLHPQLLRLLIHHIHIGRDTAGDLKRNRIGRIRCRRQGNGIQKIHNDRFIAGAVSHAGSVLFRKTGNHFFCDRDRLVIVVYIFDRNDRSHHLCHRSRIHSFIRILLGQDLMRIHIQNNGILAVQIICYGVVSSFRMGRNTGQQER